MKTILILLAACSLALAKDVTLAWDKNPEPDVKYLIAYTYNETISVQLPSTVETSLVIRDLQPGRYVFTARAQGPDGQLSESSEPLNYVLTITPPAVPKGLRVVEIQTSANLKEWKTIALIPQDPTEKPAEFVRARITTLPL